MSKVFQCLLCEKKFTEQDFKSLKFFPSTNICSACYEDAEKDKTVCFAKKDQFDRHSLACSKVCIDRKICKLYIRLQRANR
jgi:hypothetical protein